MSHNKSIHFASRDAAGHYHVGVNVQDHLDKTVTIIDAAEPVLPKNTKSLVIDFQPFDDEDSLRCHLAVTKNLRRWRTRRGVMETAVAVTYSLLDEDTWYDWLDANPRILAVRYDEQNRRYWIEVAYDLIDDEADEPSTDNDGDDTVIQPDTICAGSA